MAREITKDGVIVIDGEELRGADVVEIMKSRDTYCGWKRDADKRIRELEAALTTASAALTNAGSSLKIQADALKDAGFAAYKIRDVR